jgi:ABC-type dipeptide/oligopeptide/nickel transport system ATPase component
MAEPLLAVRDLAIQFFTYQGVVRALENVNLTIQPGEIMGLVGETGCGKSVMARSVLRLIPDPPGKITGGEILFKGETF